MLSKNELIKKVNEVLPKIQGWCSPAKASKLIEIITENKPDIVLEIGIFGGSSFLPQAFALKNNGKGVIYGIDPWSKETALEEMKADEHRKWWDSINMEKIYKGFLKHLKDNDVESYCKIIRDKSENVVDQFEDDSIGVLHIDGNHSEVLSYRDAVNYLPKVKKDGVIFFDDIFWTEEGTVTTRKAILYLLEHCEKIDVVNNDCLILRKN